MSKLRHLLFQISLYDDNTVKVFITGKIRHFRVKPVYALPSILSTILLFMGAVEVFPSPKTLEDEPEPPARSWVQRHWFKKR